MKPSRNKLTGWTDVEEITYVDALADEGQKNIYTGWSDDAPVNYIGSVAQRDGFSWKMKKLHSPVKPTMDLS